MDEKGARKSAYSGPWHDEDIQERLKKGVPHSAGEDWPYDNNRPWFDPSIDRPPADMSEHINRIMAYIHSEVERRLREEREARVMHFLWEGNAVAIANDIGEWVQFMTTDFPHSHTFESGDKVYIKVYMR